MRSPGTGTLRAARTLLLAAAIVLPSLGAHVAAGGSSPGTALLLVLVALTAVAAHPLSRRELRLPGMLGALAVGQVLLHVAFERAAALTSAGEMAAHAHHGAMSPATMVAAHVVADLVLAVALRYGEALLWRLWRWCSHRIPADGRRVVAARAARPAAPDLSVPPRSRWRGAVRGRAPPVIA
ncbi:hypothetical protein UQW22_04620 [Isoptericola halotolerans]|uniref:hypothetical protein n=1 Tax=Isoptericola halotolerans TaxID=300560 RepID=UPI00388F7743